MRPRRVTHCASQTSAQSLLVPGQTKVVQLLLDVGAQPYVADPTGTTALHLAVTYGQAEIAAALLKKDVNLVGAANSEKNTALHLAAARGHLAIIKLLVSNGASLAH